MTAEQNHKMARAIVWNADRAELIAGLLHDAADSHWVRVSRHDNEQAAYVVQRTLRTRHPDLDTKVIRVDGQQWGAEIHARKGREAAASSNAARA